MESSPRLELAKIRPGDHIAVIYDVTSELTAFVGPFVKTGLANEERCVYIIDDLTITEATAALAEAGVDVARETARGALSLVDGRQFYDLPLFEASRALELQLKSWADARSHGFMGLRLAAEMTWVRAWGVDDDTLVQFEALVENASWSAFLTRACMYRAGRFPSAVLQRLVRNHAKVIASDHVYLSLSALFQALAATDVQELQKSASERRVRRGGFYFHQGDRATEVYLLTEGKLKLVQADPDGRELIVRLVAPTETFGERAVLGAVPRPASAEALEDSRALVWDASTLLQVMMSHPAVALNAVRLMEVRVEQERARVRDLSTSSVERRLARLLVKLGESLGRRTRQGVEIELSLSGADLAELVIASPYTVSRTLAEWRRLGIADAQRERILLLDEPRLAAIAGVAAGGAPPATAPQR
jgi:CRP/FNR family transcriptional regulator, nitrogen oxide reductase regulator